MSDIWKFQTQGFNYQKYRPEYPQQLCRDALLPLKNKQKYLDIAVGTGKILFTFCQDFKQIKGIDRSDQMLSVTQSRVDKYLKNNQNKKIVLSKIDIMDLDKKQKYDLITVGQALHFFISLDTLKQLKNMLNQDGMFMTFGYVLREVHSTDPKENQYFYQFYNQMLPYFTFDMYELHHHYKDSKKYPFEQVFNKVDRNNTDLIVEMSRQDYLNYMKTWSAYNIYIQQHGVDPITKIASQGDQKVKCVFDYFRIRCYK